MERARRPAPQPVRRILVVEDDVLIRVMLAEALRERGFNVVEAANADAAWSYFSAAGEIDLILSDVQMPGSMNGVELARRIRSRLPRLPIILSSASPVSGAHEFTGFVPKPFSPDRIVSIVSEALGISDDDQATVHSDP